MASYHAIGVVEYTSVYHDKQNGGEIASRVIQHAFVREIPEALDAQDAFKKTEQALQKKYAQRPRWVTEHRNIHIVDCKLYELKEVFSFGEMAD